ncbi:hypothetical protein Tco_0921966, partial [Tanacetum coccineum]
SPSVSRVQRPKLLYSRTRQSDLKDYGKDRGIRSMITAGRPLKAAAYGYFGIVLPGHYPHDYRRVDSPSVSRVQRPKLLYSRTRQSDLKDYGKDRGIRSMITAGRPLKAAAYGYFGVRFLYIKN